MQYLLRNYVGIENYRDHKIILKLLLCLQFKIVH